MEKLVSNELLFIPKYTNLRCQQQRHHNLAKGEISPSEGGFHLPKGDFTPAKGRDFTKKRERNSRPKVAMRSLCIQTSHVGLYFSNCVQSKFSLISVHFSMKKLVSETWLKVLS